MAKKVKKPKAKKLKSTTWYAVGKTGWKATGQLPAFLVHHGKVMEQVASTYKAKPAKVSDKKIKELMFDLYKNSQKRKKSIVDLKGAAIRSQCYELATIIREKEVKLFPETALVKKQKQAAKTMASIFDMVGVPMDEKSAWMVNEIFKMIKKGRKKFRKNDEIRLKLKQEELYYK